MDYDRIKKELTIEIEWRIKELTTIKMLPLKRYLNKQEKEIAMKFAIPNIYSIWEGYVKFIFRLYINEINLLTLNYQQLDNNILSHSLETKYSQFKTGITNNFSKKCIFFSSFFSDLLNPITIGTELPTKSNINFEVINDLLDRFNLVKFPEKSHKRNLNNLLKIRNLIAHGEKSIIVNQQMIDDNVKIVTDLMDELMLKILEGCQNTTYRR